MKREFQYNVIYAFSDDPGYGNPAAVIWDPVDLSEADMQRIAKINGLSETAYLFLTDDEEKPYRIKFFTPSKSISMCGHASIASAYVYWKHKGMPDKLDYTQITDSGELKIKIEMDEETFSPKIMIGMDKPKLTRSMEFYKNAMCAILGITEEAICKEMEIYANEKGYVFIPLKTLELVKDLKPNFDQMKSFDEEYDLHGWFVYSTETIDRENDIHCRFFAPSFGVKEDPVTGTANAYFVEYYKKYHQKGEDKIILKSEQGFEIGANGIVIIDSEPSDRGGSTYIGGRAVEYVDGRLFF